MWYGYVPGPVPPGSTRVMKTSWRCKSCDVGWIGDPLCWSCETNAHLVEFGQIAVMEAAIAAAVAQTPIA